LQRRFRRGRPAAAHQAVIAIGRSVRQQASLMGYGDIFFPPGTAVAVAAVTVLYLRKLAPGGSAGDAH
jgi:MFS transporter, DHA2 family, multidrug resistance protein